MDLETEQHRTILVGNIHHKVTEGILYELFLQAGPIEKLNFPKDDRNRTKSASVVYAYGCTVNYAERLLNNTPLFGWKITVQSKISADSQTQTFRQVRDDPRYLSHHRCHSERYPANFHSEPVLQLMQMQMSNDVFYHPGVGNSMGPTFTQF